MLIFAAIDKFFIFLIVAIPNIFLFYFPFLCFTFFKLNAIQMSILFFKNLLFKNSNSIKNRNIYKLAINYFI